VHDDGGDGGRESLEPSINQSMLRVFATNTSASRRRRCHTPTLLHRRRSRPLLQRPAA